MGEIVKKCFKCEIEKSTNAFYFRRDSQKYRNECIECRNIKQKDYESENREKLKDYKKQYFQHNKNKNNEYRKTYFKNRRKTDLNFRLICNTRRRNHHALNGKSKSISTEEILGIDIDTSKKWLEFQFTTEMNWGNIEIEHVKAISLFDVSKEEELRKASIGEIHRPYLSKIIRKRGLNLISQIVNFNLLRHINLSN